MDRLVFDIKSKYDLCNTKHEFAEFNACAATREACAGRLKNTIELLTAINNGDVPLLGSVDDLTEEGTLEEFIVTEYI